MKKIAKLKSTTSSRRIKVVLAALTVLSLMNAAAIAYTLHSSATKTDNTIAILIDKAVNNLGTPATVDPISKRQFLPEASYVLPAVNETVGRVSFLTNNDYTQISSNRDVSQATAQLYNYSGDLTKLFEKVPRLQACSRGITVNTQRDEFTSFEKRLSNGKTVYMSMDQECVNNDLFNYVKQIDSY